MEKTGHIVANGSVIHFIDDDRGSLSSGVVRLLSIDKTRDNDWATVGPSIAVIKKIAKKSGSGGGFKFVLLRKKRKSVALEEGVDGKGGSETGDTTKSKSIDMEKECLVKETSFDYGESGIIADKKHDQMSKGPGTTTKMALGKPLGKINFSNLNVDDNILLDAPLELLPPLKNLVPVSVKKFFALDIGLNKVVGKFFQKKLMVIRRLFSRFNSFGRASAPSKFSGIIHAFFISEASLVQTMEKARAVDILVNTDLKKSASHSDWAVVVKEISVGTLAETADLVTAEWSILIGKDAIRVVRADLDKESWDKRNYYRVLLYILPIRTNAHDIWDFVRYAVVCFDSGESLDAVIRTTPVFRGSNLYWSSLVSAKCAKCGKLGHTSLSCAESEKISSSSSFHKVLSDLDKSKLAAIYAKCSVPVAHSVSFGGLFWVKIANRSSFSLFSDWIVSENVGSSSKIKPSLIAAVKINNRFAALEHSLASLAECVNMLAKGLATPVLMISQLRVDIVMSEGLGVAIGGETVVEAVIFDNSVIGKIEDTLRNLVIMVMGLSAKIDNTSMNKFEGVRIFTSGLEKNYVSVSVAIVMCGSLACHVSKVEKVPNRVVSVHLLFKNKLSVTFLGLYAGVLAKTKFAQAFDINLLISKAVNMSSFVVLCDDFNKNRTKKCASFKKCLDLGLVNSLGGSLVYKLSIWSNSQRINKVIDYIFISENLVLAVVRQEVVLVSDFFDTNHNIVSVSLGLRGLNTDAAKWICFKELSSVALVLFSDSFLVTKENSDLDRILKSLVVKVLKCLYSGHVSEFDHLTSKFTVILQNGSKLNALHSYLSKIKKKYQKSKYYETELAKSECIRDVIDKHMKNFNSNKSGMIRSILEQLFHKIVLDHLVIGDELILEPEEVRSRVDKIMVDWTRKRKCYNDVFSEIMCEISSDKLSLVVSELPDSKATGLSGISNKLWKHSGNGVMVCFLDLLNSCLKVGDVSDGILMNTRPIVLIETVKKILSKVLSDRISFACSKFGSSIFAVGLIVKDALEKGSYDSVGWHHLRFSLEQIKMCDNFIKFFGNIHNNQVNRIMTNFGLLDGYVVHNGLNQSEKIFYDLLLCKIKRQKHLCGYRIILNFVAKSGRVESSGVENGQASTQHILNIASKFFKINDISINNNKTVAILINSKVANASLLISGRLISIAKGDESHRYLCIFLSTEGLSKPSFAKTYADVRFFSNMVFRKAILDKQFSYLVSAVLQPIICYRTQFSFVTKRMCQKSKALLPKDFSNKTLHHPSLYGLKSFEQMQTEFKIALVIGFSNASGIFGHLFVHRALDLQVLGWAPLHSLSYSVKLRVCPLNNFLTNVVRIFIDTNISLILGADNYFDMVYFLKCFGIAFGNVLITKHGQFTKAFVHVNGFLASSEVSKAEANCSEFFCLDDYLCIHEHLHKVWTRELNVYTDGLLSSLSIGKVACGTAAFFSEVGMDVSAIALALKCVSLSCSVVFYLDSQVALDACVLEIKVKKHLGIMGNDHADALAHAVAHFDLALPVGIFDRFLMTDGFAISGNARYFVHDIYYAVNQALWEAGFGTNVLDSLDIRHIDWKCPASVWHLDSHILAGFTSINSVVLYTYLMKAVHRRLPVTI
ncbi:hypothetical protein G9A89_013946 [Geosiphon pyriformis]|nr:hypothetical protein G9A89_013946 [Geosiphon pyriformis]